MTVRGLVRGIPYVVLAIVTVLVVYGIALYAIKEIGPDHRYRVYVYFHNADGLRVDSDVKIGGVPGGQVTDLRVINDDLAKATVLLNSNAAPIGQGASAQVRPVNLLGEKYIDLSPGDLRQPVPSGSSIPVTRTGAPVELDDVLNMLQPDVRALLRILIDEFGVAMDGQGANFSQVLEDLPPSLDQARQLVASFAADNQRLEQLITAGDQDLSAFNRHSAGLNGLVVSAANALAVTASKRQQLANTVGQAPATLAQLRSTLAQLQSTAAQLAPAADELRASAAPLTQTLDRLPAFAAAAAPALRTAQNVAPTLTRLGQQATAPLARVSGTVAQLASYAAHLNPLSAGLDQQASTILGVIEGWARTISSRDTLGHLFRTQVTFDKQLLTSALSRYEALLGQDVKPTARTATAVLQLPHPSPGPAPSGPTPATNAPSRLPKLPRPKVSLPSLGGLIQQPQPPNTGQGANGMQSLLNYLLGP